MSTETLRPLKFAAVLYHRDTTDKSVLVEFVEQIQARGFDVRGVFQEKLYEDGSSIGMDAIDFKTKERYILSRPSKEDKKTGTCGFDPQNLLSCIPILKNAIEDNSSLLVVEKFGEREQSGIGFMDEILEAALMGIPILVSVPVHAIESWVEISGGLSEMIAYNETHLWAWWPKVNLYADLAYSVPNIPIKDIVIGEKTLLIETEQGCGALDLSESAAAAPLSPQDKDALLSCDLNTLAQKVIGAKDHLSFTIGLCACLAHTNRYDVEGPDNSGLTHFNQSDASVLAIGPFPKDKIQVDEIDFAPRDQLISRLSSHSYEGIIAPSSVLMDQQIVPLLEKRAQADVVLVGPHTPLSDRLFNYGFQVLSGRVIEEAAKAKELVKSGASLKDLKAASRYVTIEKTESA